ncbi:MAG: thiamine transport system ATP-binding protein [Chloroflexi bacterium]|jgi:ABC-type Fe3+/spermidine/putrescine transport system ATPase subunit|nr:MAG: thiamine transport system ATP-binding protein [Chloroflexota bacterium]
MAILEVGAVSKSFGNKYAVHNMSLAAEQGDIVCLLGPSGCGKTTLLRLIAGLEEPDQGYIKFDGEPFKNQPAQDRGFGLMFQDLALFPHMNVFRNVAFGLHMKRLPKQEIRSRVEQLLELVSLVGYEDRKIYQLSGGERQRVALARSLAPQPRLLMFDEPFGSLDRELSEALQVDVRNIIKTVGVTAIYVTHDRNEAFGMADSIVVMENGTNVQAGSPHELFTNPKSEIVAKSLGLRNVFSARFEKISKAVTLISPIGTLKIDPNKDYAYKDGSEVLAIIDQKAISISLQKGKNTYQGNTLEGVVEMLRFQGPYTEIIVRCGKATLSCLATPQELSNPEMIDAKVYVTIPSYAVRLLSKE